MRSALKSSDKPSLLFLSHCYPSRIDDMRGGFFLPLIKRLQDSGIMVEVLTPDWGGVGAELSMETGRHGEKIWRFPWDGERPAALTLKNPLSLVNLIHFLVRWRRALRTLDNFGCNWSCALAAWGLPAGLLLRTQQLKRKPSAIWWLGTDFNRFDAPWFIPLFRFVGLGGRKNNWSNSWRIVDGLKRRAGISAEFIPLLSRPNVDYACQKTTEFPRIPRVLSVGRLERVKGFDIGISAALAVLRRGTSFEYRLIGTGSQRYELERMIKGEPNIKLLGYLDEDALNHELRESDIVLIPSRQEGMPLVFFEALAAGKLVVVTDVGDLRKCLEGTQLGLVSHPSDVVGLADNLERALQGALVFDAKQAENLFKEYSLDHTVSAVNALISKREIE